MTRLRMDLRSACIFTCALIISARIWCDDSAAAIGAGGLVSRRETRVVMAKEVLKIGLSRVQVDYDFRNGTDQDVRTEVAFPIPPYKNGPEDWPVERATFSDFVLTVDNRPVKYEIEAQAFLRGREFTPILVSEGIDVSTFGHWDPNRNLAPDLSRLPKSEQEKLTKLGLFNSEERWGNWTVRLQYHWTQTFAAHSTVHIHHEYTPIQGFATITLGAIRKALHQPAPEDRSLSASKWEMKLLNSFCPDMPFLLALERSMAAPETEEGVYAHPEWVEFVLTSANTWRRPIEDFTLIVDRGEREAGEPDTLATFCSPEHADVNKVSETELKVHLTDFVPRSELRIGFFRLPEQVSNSERQ